MSTDLELELQKKLDSATFELAEYDRAVRLDVIAVGLGTEDQKFGDKPLINVLVDGSEPITVQPGMQLMVMLPKEE